MRLSFVVLVAVAGCKVVDAPEALEDLAVFGFVHFESGDAFRETTADGLVQAMVDNEAELFEGYRVDSLTAEDLAAADVDASEPESLVGIAAVIPMQSSLDDVVAILSADDIAEKFTTTLVYEVLESTDRACFLAHECESYAFTATRTNDLGIMGTSEQVFQMTMRWVELSDGRTGMMARQLIPDETVTSSDLLNIHQNYILDFIQPTASGGTQRFQANWIDIEVLGLDLPDAFALDLAVSSLNRRAAEIDALVSGG